MENYYQPLINKIWQENCINTMARMPDGFIDLTVTSPPYDNLRDYHGYDFQFEEIAKELERITKQGGVVVWIVNDAMLNGSETLTSCKQKIFFREECGFNIHDTMIWRKPGASNPSTTRYHQVFEYMFILSKGNPNTFNGMKDRKNKWQRRFGAGTVRSVDGEMNHSKEDRIKYGEYGLRENIWDIITASQENICQPNDHPAQFSEQLAGDHILSWNNEGDLIYDPMGGSGTVAKMAHLLKRNWIMSEISAEYCELAQKRIEPYICQPHLL